MNGALHTMAAHPAEERGGVAPSWRAVLGNGAPPLPLAGAAREAARGFPFRCPPALAERVDWQDPADPLARQFLPTAAELERVAGYVTDPLEEAAARRAPGLLIKYAGRALLLASGRCAVHCRFCFRRHAPAGGAPPTLDALEPALEEIRADASVEEVLLSGGDPLMRDDPFLAHLVRRLAAIPQLRRLRLHSRMPVVLPQRVTPGLLRALTATPLTPVLVLHVNHPAELDDLAGQALDRLARGGVLLYAQSVLLAGVNDEVETLFRLYRELLARRVTPYYLHLLDPVAGAAHFAVPEARGVALMEELRARLPGYAVPRLVREEPGATGKRVVA